MYGWPPLLTLVFIWLLWLRQRPSWQDGALLTLLAGTVGLYVAYWAAGIMYGPRYYYAALPAMVLLTARGIVVMQEGRDGRFLRSLIMSLVLALVAGNLIFNSPWLDGRFVFARDLGDEANSRLLAHFPDYQVVRWWENGVLEIVPDQDNS